MTRTPNYFVQQMFSCNRGDEVLPLEISGLKQNNSLFTSAVRDDSTGDIILKVVHRGEDPARVEIKLSGGLGSQSRVVRFQQLFSAQLTAENLAGQPLNVSPKADDEPYTGDHFGCQLPPNSFSMMRISSR